MTKSVSSIIEFRRARTAKEKQSIAQGMRDFWKTQPKGAKGDVETETKPNKKLAIGVVSGLAAVGALGYAAKKGKLKSKILNKKNQLIQQLDNKLEQQAFVESFARVVPLPSKQGNALDRFLEKRFDAIGRGIEKGTKEGFKQKGVNLAQQLDDVITNSTKKTKDYVLSTPQRTAEAFHEGYRKGGGSRETLGKRLAVILKKAKQKGQDDLETTKKTLGFKLEKGSLIEFKAEPAKPAKKASKPRKLDPQHRQSISRGLIDYWNRKGRKKEDKENKEEGLTKKQVAIGVGVGAAATVGGLLLAQKIIKRDLKKSQVDFGSIRQPPGGVPDAKTLAKYDDFVPGSLIRKNFKSDRMGTRQHYAVYMGKDKATGEHMLIDTGIDWKSRDQVPYVRKRGLTWDAGPNDSEYEMVTDLLGGGKVFSQQEILDRADAMLYQRFRYEGFTSNCEAFARGIVEGKAYSTQAEAVSGLTNTVSGVVTNNLLKFRSPADYFPGSDSERKNRIISALSRNKLTGASEYFNEKYKWSAGEMTEFLNNRDLVNTVIDPRITPSKEHLKLIAKLQEMERVRDARRKSWEYLKNPYGNDSQQRALPPASRPKVSFSKMNYKEDQPLTFSSDLCFAEKEVSDPDLEPKFVEFLNMFGLENPKVFAEKVEKQAKNYEGDLAKVVTADLYQSYFFLTLYCMKSLISNAKKGTEDQEVKMSKRHDFWIEFNKKKAKPAKKQLSAQHRAAISKGLREHYDSIPKKQETKLDRVDKITRSILRTTRAAKTGVEAGTLGYSLYKVITSKPAKKTFLDSVQAGVNVVNTVSGSLSKAGSGISSLAKAGDAVHDITSGSKRRKLALKEEALKIKARGTKSYGRLVESSAQSNRPGGTKFEEMLTRRAKLEESGGLSESLKDILSRRK